MPVLRAASSILLLLVSSLTAVVAQDQPSAPRGAHYTVRATTTVADDSGFIPLDVTLRLTAPAPGRTVFELPSWTPGSYRLRSFAERVRDLRAAEDGGRALAVTPLRRGAWQVSHGALPAITVSYRVLLAPNDRFMYPGDSRRCLTFEGPAVYLYAVGSIDVPCRVAWDLPQGWNAWSGLARQPDGTDFAPDYDALADCPVKLGVAQDWTFESHGVPVRVVVDAGADVDDDQSAWLANVKRVVDQAGRVFGGLPFERYTFLLTVGPGGGGGLEHLTSTTIGMRRLNRPDSGIGTIAHEFFHVWNVKRLRPVELGPFDYTRPVRTRGLWISEGFTTYYGSVLRARAGLLAADRFWRGLAGAIASFESSSGRPHVTSYEASEGAWSNSAPDRGLSYYTSGQVLALLLDLELRHRSGNAHGLDDFLRELWQLCEREGRGFLLHEPAAVAQALTGTSFAEWFDRYPGGTVVPDYATVLGYAGLRVDLERTVRNELRGVRSVRGKLLFADHRALERIDRQADIDPFTVAGELVAIDDVEVASEDEVAAIVAAHRPGDRLRTTFTALTGAERKVTATIEERARLRVTIEPDPAATPGQVAIRAAITAARQ